MKQLSKTTGAVKISNFLKGTYYCSKIVETIEGKGEGNLW